MPIPKKIFSKLQEIVGKENCSNEKEDLACYAYDATAQFYMPDAIVFPKTSLQVSEILKLASLEEIYVIPRGSGSGLTGGALAVKGGIIVVMSRFNRIVEIDGDNLIARVEPGVIAGDFHAAVEKEGLFYPPDPASSGFSTLGGNIAECSGGPRAVKYGVTKDYVLGLEAVIPAGEIINVGVETTKGVVGYDLTKLLVGSEGTLAIITQITLRLLPLPEAVRTMTAIFDDMETAAATVSAIIKSGIIPRTVEYMDQASIQCVENYLKAGLPVNAGALLIIEVDGTINEADLEIEKLIGICIKQGAARIESAITPSEVSRLWAARRSINPALFQYGPYKINEDIVVPRSKMPDMVKKIKNLRESSGLVIASYGHAGDGNIHVNLMLDKQDKTAMEKANRVIEELFDYTLKLRGTISGEHGVGITKSHYIHKEIGLTELTLMKKIKDTFDPKGILNPGKIFS